MSASRWVRAPLDPRLSAWRTVPTRRTVLVAVHTVASANRLVDVTSIFDSDHRIQVVYTTPGSSVVSEGVEQLLAEAGMLTIPWDQAIAHPFDLAISANHSGDLHKIDAPLVLLSHGIGYTKYKPETGNRKPETGNRKPETGNRKPETGNRKPVYGMSRDWLVRDGRVFAAALGLSHRAQLGPLAAAVPEAVEIATVVGDPCLDRLRASRPRRSLYRRALRADPGTTVVTLSSTWGPRSLLGQWPELPRELLAEVDADATRVLLVLHPHVWWTHGHAQLRVMFADAIRAGLTLVPPVAGWQQAVLASDVVVGDHGAVTGYAAAAGIPMMVGAFPADEVVPGTAIAAMGTVAPRLDRTLPLVGQVREAVARHRPEAFGEVARLASGALDEAAGRLRRLGYRLLRLSEPALPAPVPPLPVDDLPTPAEPRAFLVTGTVSGEAVRLVRRAADVSFGVASRPDPDGFLAVPDDHPLRVLRAAAAVVHRPAGEARWVADDWPAAATRPPSACRVAAVIESDTACVVHCGGVYFRLETPDARVPVDALPAALHRWRLTAADPPPGRLLLTLAGRTVPITVTRLS